ncbi:uncharacterized protein LOC132724790 [Ruditapes philippinarum]|uniref:uncharacterized protein LOC132724790 n=1 Tax=Ruditapes philippinarum TaxID=129788 RepID=UPI00295B8677|nr:uncharacterized protein LOC132724790 [Ruditapes philippinarum]
MSPDIVQMAVMFMYGKIPEFTIVNIGDLLELAEYLKIKELKDACIDWFDSVDYSDINCIYVIQLSKKFDFEIFACIEYIESHIPETFQHNDAADLPNDLVHRLFTDERFSYVQIDDKLNFLVKLANTYPNESTKDFVIKLFETLDLSEVTLSAWETVKEDVMLNKILNLETKVRQTDQKCSRNYVLLMSSGGNYFVGLDLRNDRWCRLNSIYYDQYPYEELWEEIAGVRNDNPELYFVEEDDSAEENVKHVITVDLCSNEIDRFTTYVEFEEVQNGHIVDFDFTHVNITNDSVVGIVNKTVRINEDSEDSSSSESESECVCSCRERENQNDITSVREAHLSPEIISDRSVNNISCATDTPERSVSVRSSNSSSRSSSVTANGQEGTINFTTVYVVETQDEDFEMRSLFSFRKEKITQICMNNQSVLGLLAKTKKRLHVILYDLVQCKMDRIFSLFRQKDKYKICPTKHGFLLHNNTSCYCFTKAGNYKVEKFMLENRDEWMVKYLFQCGVWIRVLRRSVHHDIELQYIVHEELADYHSSIDVNWRNVSMPKDKRLFEKILNLKNIFIVSLSKSKLRCNIECPHCKFSDKSD